MHEQLAVPDSDIEVVIHSTMESGPDAEKLDFLRVDAVHAVGRRTDRPGRTARGIAPSATTGTASPG